MNPKTNGNLPIHATEEMHIPVGGHPGRTQCIPAQPGLTKREHFAAMAMQGLSANPQFFDVKVELVAQWAVSQADALLRALAAGGEG